jgi:ABC-type glycerol-3-phosphate transport system permease component
MRAIAWIATILATYAAAALWLALVIDAVRHRRWGQVVALVAAGGIGLTLWLTVPGPRPLPVLAGAAPVLVYGIASYAVVNRRARDWKETTRRRRDVRTVVLHLVLATGALIFSLPFVWLVSTSLKPDARLMVVPPEWIPNPVLWINYSRAVQFLPAETKHGLMYFWNTLYISMMSITGTVLAASMVAYSFARLRWPGRDFIFVILLATLMLPSAVTMIPVFLIYRALGWVDTLRPLWVPAFFGGAFNIFLLRQFFMTIPRDLEDAAKIDGCSFFGIYWRIMLPLIKPALAAVVIMTFMGSWNDFMGPLIYVSSPEKMPLAYALQLYQSAHSTEYNLLMAAATMVVVPVILLFFFTQRYFIQGVTLTGIKG